MCLESNILTENMIFKFTETLIAFPPSYQDLFLYNLQIAIEAITNIRTVAGLHKEEHFANEYSKALLKPHEEALKKSHLRGRINKHVLHSWYECIM